MISIDGADRDKFIFKDSKNVVTLTFDGDKQSKLTINKTKSEDAITFNVGGEVFTYGARPTGVTFDNNDKKTALKVGSTAANGVVVDAADIVSTVKTLDGSTAGGSVHLIGNEQANVLKAGAHGSTLDGGLGADKLYGGSGEDIFVYALGQGADAMYKCRRRSFYLRRASDGRHFRQQ